MTPRRAKIYVWLFLALCGAVGGNVLLLQPRAATSGASASITMVETGAARVGGRAVPRSAGETVSGDVDTVRAVQRELKRLGYFMGTVDGVDGPILRAAVWDFEQSNGRPVKALPDDAVLRDALFASDRVTARAGAIQVAGPAAEQLVRTVQQSLANQGLSLARPDGRFNDETARALREFETRRGLKPTGRISADLVHRLLAADSQAAAQAAARIGTRR